jgi:exodeoxyribonuclease-1
MGQDQTLFFYDLETSGLDPGSHRIMQFAGQRTDMELNAIGDPINLLVRLANDVLPNPQSVMVHGITPQKTQHDGLSEAEFARVFQAEVSLPGTTMVGFNSSDFDDEFLRFTLYRNFHEPYSWFWKDGRSRWDLLDPLRMTRAIRPDGIMWPSDGDGSPINTLIRLAEANNIPHINAHDALSDVNALIGMAQLLKARQPRLWSYLLSLRSKEQMSKVISPYQPQPFLYTSGFLGKDVNFTTAAVVIGTGEREGTFYTFDLRHDPTPFSTLTADEIRERVYTKSESLTAMGLLRPPVGELNIKKSPIVAPLSVLDKSTEARINLTHETIRQNLSKLAQTDLPAKVAEAFRETREFKPQDVDAALYEGFVQDEYLCRQVSQAKAENIAALQPNFRDRRLPELFVRYKARNYPDSLTVNEQAIWEKYRSDRILQDSEEFSIQVEKIWAEGEPKARQLMEDLQLWQQSAYPSDVSLAN